MRFIRNLFISLFCANLVACVSTTLTMSANNFEETRESVSVIVMKPDVEVFFDKVGSTDLRADWTQEVTTNLKAAIVAHLKRSGEKVIEFETLSSDIGDIDQMIALNEQISRAMGKHVFAIGTTPFLGTLPHKKENGNKLTYSLGEAVAPIRAATDADYAAFLTYRAAIESTGSLLTKVALGALTGIYAPSSDFRGTLVSLVDLNTGEVVWLNSNAGSGGDARKPESASRVINKIMDKGPFVETES